MKRNARKRILQALTRGTVRWLLLLAVPFAMLFTEAWLHLQILQNGYHTVELRSSIRDKENRIRELTACEASYGKLQQLEANARALGLVEPQLSQIEVVRLHPSPNEQAPGADPAGVEFARLPKEATPTTLAPNGKE